MLPHREGIHQLMHAIIQEGEQSNTLVQIRGGQSGKHRRGSIVALSDSLRWLVPKFYKYNPGRWWAGPLSLVLRLCATSMMIVFQKQSIQAAYACVIAQLAICLQQSLRPYRRKSDNEIAFLANWLIFIWCAVLLMRTIGSFASLPSIIIGMVCVLPTLAVVARALTTTISDIKAEFQERDEDQAADEVDTGVMEQTTGRGDDSETDAGIELGSMTSQQANGPTLTAPERTGRWASFMSNFCVADEQHDEDGVEKASQY